VKEEGQRRGVKGGGKDDSWSLAVSTPLVRPELEYCIQAWRLETTLERNKCLRTSTEKSYKDDHRLF